MYKIADTFDPMILGATLDPAARSAVHIHFSEPIAGPPAGLVVLDRATGNALPPEAYDLRLDTAANSLATDFTFHLVAPAADANHDRLVDFQDLAILAQNYNSPSTTLTFAHGDFNYDHRVDFNDLAILAQRYPTSLPPPEPAPALIFNSTTPISPAKSPKARPARSIPVKRPA